MYYRRAAFCCAFFLWAEGLSAKGIHEEMFPAYCGKCLSRKALHNWIQKRGKRYADDEEVKMEVRKWLRQQSKYFYAAGFDTGKAMGQAYQCWWRIRREINIFASFEYHMFYVLCPFVTYLLTLPSNTLIRLQPLQFKFIKSSFP
jgi:hypothetical protein